MSFDWFTFVAQLLNFGILLVLLRTFLYRPVLDMMDQREERLATAWHEAETSRNEARERAARLERELEDLKGQRQARLAAIEAEARELLDRRLTEVESEVAAQRSRQLVVLEEGRERTVQRLRQRTAQVLLSELRASLADLAGDGLEEHAARVFTDRLRELPADRLAELGRAAASSWIEVTSAAELTEEQRSGLARELRELLGAEAEVSFAADPELLFGTELRAGPVLVAVSGRQRLAALEAEFNRSLTEVTRGA